MGAIRFRWHSLWLVVGICGALPALGQEKGTPAQVLLGPHGIERFPPL